jgi:hypothetical protein
MGKIDSFVTDTVIGETSPDGSIFRTTRTAYMTFPKLIYNPLREDNGIAAGQCVRRESDFRGTSAYLRWRRHRLGASYLRN